MGIPASCELLSKLSIFDTTNNNTSFTRSYNSVVNCFQNLVSLIRQTTAITGISSSLGCELLSKLSIFDTTNNPRCSSVDAPQVVNCFQNLVSLIRQTTFEGLE